MNINVLISVCEIGVMVLSTIAFYFLHIKDKNEKDDTDKV